MELVGPIIGLCLALCAAGWTFEDASAADAASTPGSLQLAQQLVQLGYGPRQGSRRLSKLDSCRFRDSLRRRLRGRLTKRRSPPIPILARKKPTCGTTDVPGTTTISRPR